MHVNLIYLEETIAAPLPQGSVEISTHNGIRKVSWNTTQQLKNWQNFNRSSQHETIY